MNRAFTNVVRFLMDECLPPIIRDNKYFMYPFYRYAYRGKNIKAAMDFKRQVFSMTPREYRDFYDSLDTISRNRESDLSAASIHQIVECIDASAMSLLDVGCGRGYFLSQLKNSGLRLTGFDAVHAIRSRNLDFVQGDICSLPFEDGAFDVVTCCHTLEHIPNLPKAISELKRVARRQLIVVVPFQRPFRYTLDEHIHFFHFEEQLTSLFDLEDFTCRKIWGDWLYVAQLGQKPEVVQPLGMQGS